MRKPLRKIATLLVLSLAVTTLPLQLGRAWAEAPDDALAPADCACPAATDCGEACDAACLGDCQALAEPEPEAAWPEAPAALPADVDDAAPTGEGPGLSPADGPGDGTGVDAVEPGDDPVPPDTPDPERFGLIFESSSGRLYVDGDGNNIVSAGDAELAAGRGVTWDAEPYVLRLMGLSWTTSAPNALTFTAAERVDVVVAAGTSSSFISTYNGYHISTGICSIAATLAFSGGGTLTACGGVPNDASSYGILGSNQVTLLSGRLIAQGRTAEYESVGITATEVVVFGGSLEATGGMAMASCGVLADRASVTGGSLLAIGGNAIPLSSIGLNCRYSVQLNSGSLTASGQTKAVVVPPPHYIVLNTDAYAWWASESAADPGGSGTLYYPTSGNAAFAYSEGYRYVRLSSERLALVDDVTVTGLVGQPLSAERAVTVRLYGAKAAALAATDASGWFDAGVLPGGISATANAVEGGDVIIITLSGTPSAASSATLALTVPGSAMNDGYGAVRVASNPNARLALSVPPLVFRDNAAYDLPAMTVGRMISPVSVTGGVSGGLPPYSYSATGLPAGLAINATSGELYGIPLSGGPGGQATVTVTDAVGQAMSVTVAYGERVADFSSGTGTGTDGTGQGSGSSLTPPTNPRSGTTTGTGGSRVPKTGDSESLPMLLSMGLSLIFGLAMLASWRRDRRLALR